MLAPLSAGASKFGDALNDTAPVELLTLNSAASVPVISSDIPGSIGILGAGYPGYFPVGQTRALAALLHRAESDAKFLGDLRRWCRRLRPLVDPARERATWGRLLRELATDGRRRTRTAKEIR